MQTVLITGANGFVGYYLTLRLLKKNYKVIATGKGANRLPFSHKQLTYETLDFTSEENIKAVFEKYRPDVVVHSGAISKPDECETNKREAFLTNVSSTLYLVQQAAAYQCHFIFLSTDFVFAGEQLLYQEDDGLQPVNYYGETKKLAEEEVKKYPFGWSIVRTVLVYGHPQGGRQNFVTMVASALKKGDTLNIYDDQTRTPTYVEDLVFGLEQIITQNKKGIYHLSGKDVITIYDLAIAVADYLQLDKTKINRVTAQTFKQPAARPPITGFDLSKAINELDYRPTSLQEGLKKTFET